MNTSRDHQPPGGRLSYWLAAVLRKEREAAGRTRQDIATMLGTSVKTIDRFESGESLGRDAELYVAAYAYALGLEDSRELWARAVQSWLQKGVPPVFRAEGPAEAYARAIRNVALRQRQSGGERSERRNTTRRRAEGS